jgi:hypothetical protein
LGAFGVGAHAQALEDGQGLMEVGGALLDFAHAQEAFADALQGEGLVVGLLYLAA